MIRRSAIAVGILGASLLGGCADLMQRSTIAPEWFQAKAVEVKGEGYPSLANIPESRGPVAPKAEWQAQAASLHNESNKIEAKSAEDPEAPPTEEELRAMAAQWRAQIDKGTTDTPAAATPADTPPRQTP